MKKLAIALVASTVFVGASSGALARDLTIVSWGGNFQDAQREIYFEPFARATGKRVLEESWDGGYGVLQARVQAGTPNWDVVSVEAEELTLGCADGIFEKVDWSLMGGEDAFMPAAVSDCGVGGIVWSTGITYDADRLSDGPVSWEDFWNVEKFPGKRGMRKGAKYALEIALLADGVALSDVYSVLATSEGVDRAFRKLDEIKPHMIWWEAGAQPLQLLSSGEVVMTTAYNGRVAGINRSEGKNFQFVFPGSIYAIDSWVVLKGSPNMDAAFEFIAFASRPENQSKLPEYIAYGLPNLEAGKLVPEEYQAELPTTPANLENAIPLDADFWADHSEELTQRFNAWLAL